MSLNLLRQEIDMLDEEIIKTIGKRIELARQVARVKKEERLPILDAKREEEIRAAIRKLAKKEGLSAPIMVEIIQLILDYSRIEMGLI
ncbi:MAG: chorismate mutase [Parachlamydiales bacterium]|nr:chorismate mutase [Parachlamydiales bacterium]